MLKEKSGRGRKRHPRLCAISNSLDSASYVRMVMTRTGKGTDRCEVLGFCLAGGILMSAPEYEVSRACKS